MSKTARTLTLGASLLVALVAAAWGATNANDSSASLRKVFDTMVAAAARGDDAALRKFQSKAATFIDGSGFSASNDEYLGKLGKGVGVNAAHSEMKNFRVNDVRVSTEGNAGWVTYQYRLVPTTVGAEKGEIFGYATIVFRKEEGGWRVAHSHTTGRSATARDPAF
jgi:ketosteroid isomerase-like protein